MSGLVKTRRTSIFCVITCSWCVHAPAADFAAGITSEYLKITSKEQWVMGKKIIDCNEFLKWAQENGKMEIVTYIQEEMDMSKRQELLNKHPYKIWQGSKNKKWYTYLPDQKQGRIPKKRNTREEIEEVIIAYWKEQEANPTLQDVFDEWILKKFEYDELQASSVEKYSTDFKRFFVRSRFSDKRIKFVTEDMLEDFIRSQIAENKLTTKTFAGLRIIINGMFKYAKKRKWTQISISSFMNDLEISRNAFQKKIIEPEKQVLMEDEIPVLSAALRTRGTIWDFGVLLIMQTGLRVGELAALKKQDWADDILKIRRTEIRSADENGKYVNSVRDFTKTEAGIRDVILTDGGKETLRKILEINPDGEYLFENNGKRIRGNTFNKHLGVVLKSLGMEHRSIHKLRKTYITTLIDSGCDDSTIMKQVGHKSIETSRGYYYFSNKVKEHRMEQIRNAIAI